MRSIADRASRKMHKTADSTNDYDKAPGMDSYLDTTRRTKLKVDDFLFRYEMEQADKKEKDGGWIPFETY